MAINDITGDNIATRLGGKEAQKNFDDNFDRIFRKKPQSLEAAYERRAMEEGLVTDPVFDENRIDVIGQNGNVGYTDDDLQK